MRGRQNKESYRIRVIRLKFILEIHLAVQALLSRAFCPQSRAAIFFSGGFLSRHARQIERKRDHSYAEASRPSTEVFV